MKSRTERGKWQRTMLARITLYVLLLALIVLLPVSGPQAANQTSKSLLNDRANLQLPSLPRTVGQQSFWHNLFQWIRLIFQTQRSLLQEYVGSFTSRITSSGTIQPVYAATTWYVNANTGNDSNNCSTPTTACITINGAIGKASSGDTIAVAAGAYFENVVVSEPLTLTGASSATVIVTAADNTLSVFTVTASNVNISGFTATGTVLSGNQGYAGIKFGNGVTNSNIHDNILSNNQYGILLIETLGNTASGNNVFTNNTASNCVVSGIEMQNTNGNTFTNNIANSNGAQGFRLANSKNNTFTNNTANSNGQLGNTSGGVGFFLVVAGGTGSNNNTFTNNTAKTNVNHGFRIDGSTGNTLKGNTSDSNGADGIKLKSTSSVGSSSTTMNGNDFTHNSGYGIDIADTATDATSLTVKNNNIVGNTLAGANNLGTGTLTAKYNWWGCSAGPGIAGCDITLGSVNFNPWLTELYAPTKSVVTPAGTVSFSSSDGALQSLTAQAVSSISPSPPAGLTFPDGLFSFTIVGLTAGETVTVTITLPSPLPAGTFSYWKFHSASWQQMAASKATLDSTRSVVTLTLTDGATPDDSDSVTGQITDPSGPAINPTVTTVQTTTTTVATGTTTTTVPTTVTGTQTIIPTTYTATTGTLSTTTVSTSTLTTSTTSTAHSSVIPPVTIPAIPGFPWESIVAGILLGLGALAIIRRRKNTSNP